MKHFLRIILLAALAMTPLYAQVSNPSIIIVSSAPSGSCTQNLPDEQVIMVGSLYSCQNGTWGQIGGSSGSGTVGSGTTNQIAIYPSNGTSVQGASTLPGNYTFSGTGNAFTAGGLMVATTSGHPFVIANNNFWWSFTFELISSTEADLVTGSNDVIGWGSTNPTSPILNDTGFSRGAAATIDLGNGTPGSTSGTLNLATVAAGTTVKIPVTLVSALPSAATLGAGAIRGVSDMSNTTPGHCTGSGTAGTYVIAISDGTNWNCP